MTTIGFPMLGKWGRLGNSLWQIASTVGMARRLGMEPIFPEDWAYRRWFSVPDEMFGPAEACDFLAVSLAPKLTKANPTYLQDFALWRDSYDEVRALLKPSLDAEQEAWSTIPEFFQMEPPVLSVHVRRGDNAYDPAVPDKWRYHPLRPLVYYEQAIALAGGLCETVACFSDDPHWCVENIDATFYLFGHPQPKENEPGYDDPPMDWVDLVLMTHCDRHVISNSSFGYWGAMLSDDPEPIYGWPWYGPALAHEPAHLMFPSSWRRLEIPELLAAQENAR